MSSSPPEIPDAETKAAAGQPCAAGAISQHFDTRTAATELAESIHGVVGDTCDLMFVFGSFHHRAAFEIAVQTLRQTVHPTTTIGVTAESVLGGDLECEGLAALSVLALRLPGLNTRVWSAGPGVPLRAADHEELRDQTHLNDDAKGVIVVADPFTTPINDVLRALSSLSTRDQPVPIMGGLASGASQPGHNMLIMDDHVQTAGIVGVTLSGDVEISCVVSQGCRPIGEPHVITRGDGNTVFELSGRPATEVLREEANELNDHDKALLGRGLFVGTVINEHKAHFGRGDFLIRAVTGMDNDAGSLVVGDRIRTGQTIQFHVRDADTADEDLQLLLDLEQLNDPPLAALLFTCNSRGSRLFHDEHHDVRLIRSRLGDVPLAGFFAGGEVGPVGQESFLHGHTACLVLFRSTHKTNAPLD
ncbi:MAG: FIST N-terminal domain-containing protein [Planctomycetota bacterium]